MGTILVKAVSLILIIVIGYVLKRIGWFSLSDFPKFAKIVFWVTLPCSLITSFNTFDIYYGLLFLVAIGVGAILIQQVAGYLLNLRKGAREQAFGILSIGSYNIGAFAMPYISGFIGTQSMIYASLFDIGSSIGAAGIGYSWARSVTTENVKVTVGRLLKNMLSSPIFDTYLFLLIMRLMDLRLPDAVITFTSVVGSANTFMAMLMIGIGLELHLNAAKYKMAFRYLGIRYFFALILTILIAFFTSISQEIKTVLCMLFFSPIAAMITGFISEIKGDVETSAFMTSVSIIVGIVVMPLILAIMS